MRIDEFLLARIAEDEAMARGAKAVSSANWIANNSLLMFLDSERYAECLGSVEHYGQDPAWFHVERHDPARVLAECEAKRRVVELHPPEPRYVEVQTMSEAEPREVYAGTYIPTELRLIAAVYADHPDFDPAWRL